jgi:hypothetical protein
MGNLCGAPEDDIARGLKSFKPTDEHSLKRGGKK